MTPHLDRKTGGGLPRRHRPGATRHTTRRLDAEVVDRFQSRDAEASMPTELSKVEKAMLRNAPDLAGATPEHIARDKAQKAKRHCGKWPRPRLSALIFLGALAIANPNGLQRLVAWSLLILLIACIAIGPEKVREGGRFALKRLRNYLSVEIALTNGVWTALRRRFET